MKPAGVATVALDQVTATLPATALITIIGNPNSGKSTLFNKLTGLRQKTANFPGVTVEKHSGLMSVDGRSIELIDLPGTFSLSVHSADEQVAVDVLLGRVRGTRPPDGVLVVADATRLYQGLFLVEQVLDLGLPVVLALTMVDVATAQGTRIDFERLSHHLGGIPVCPVVALSGAGIPALKQQLVRAIHAGSWSGKSYWPQLRTAAEQLRTALGESADALPVFEAERVIIDGELASFSQRHGLAPEFVAPRLTQVRQELCGATPPLAAEARERYTRIQGLLPEVITAAPILSLWNARLAAWLNRPLPASILFLVVMALVFQAVFAWATPVMDLIDAAVGATGEFLRAHLPPGLLASLLVDGVIAGVGSVVIFLPQILILFFFIIVLEDTGYIARAAFLVDRAMAAVGLSGQSVIPMLSCFACAVPGIMAARVIPDRRDRIATIMAAPFMTCSARLPVYALLIAAFIPDREIGAINLQGLVLLGLYLLGIAGGVTTAFLLKRTALHGPKPTFVLALPEFRIPSWRGLALRLLDRARVFLRRAGTVIFLVSVVVWALSTFPRSDSIEAERVASRAEATQTFAAADLERALVRIDNQAAAAQLEQSWLGRLGHGVAPIFKPLGWDWRISAAVLASFPAREVVIAVLGTIYAVGAEADTANIAAQFRSATWPDGAPVFTLPMVCGLLIFYALCLQCAATLAVIKRETNSWRWPIFAWSYMTTLGYVGALLVNQLG